MLCTTLNRLINHLKSVHGSLGGWKKNSVEQTKIQEWNYIDMYTHNIELLLW